MDVRSSSLRECCHYLFGACWLERAPALCLVLACSCMLCCPLAHSKAWVLGTHCQPTLSSELTYHMACIKTPNPQALYLTARSV